MKKKSYINKGFLIIILCLVVLFSGVVVEAQNLNNLLQEEEKTLDEETIKKLEEVLSIIDTYYVEETSEEELIENALKGMVGELDDFSLYMNEDEFDEQEFQMEGEYGGIGLRVMTIEDELTIVSPFKDTPGDRAGLQAGDVIKEVNGKPTSEMTQEKAVEIMRGEPGTSVELLISRKEEEEDFSVEIIREEIEIPFVSTEMETERIGYISITQFMEDVGTDVEAEIEKLQDEGAEALILDLRNNPGGLLPEALNVASNFIDEGELLYSESRLGKESYNVNEDIQAVDLPVVVLINKGSASGSEIVAGVLQDKERARLVGTPTFGKGSVQTLLPLNDGAAVKVTTAIYYLPSGAEVNEKGVNPDVEVELEQTGEEAEIIESPEDIPSEEEQEEQEQKDAQLDKAIEILEEEYLK